MILTRSALIAAFASVMVAPVQFVHDSRPLPDVPFEARHAGTGPGSESKDYGPLKAVIARPIRSVRIRYFDPQAFNRTTAESFVTKLIGSDTGSTHTHIFWAEGLGVPLVEAYLYSDDASFLGHLLAWQKRAVYQDAAGKWWFSAD
jgi:hypothetical protein